MPQIPSGVASLLTSPRTRLIPLRCCTSARMKLLLWCLLLIRMWCSLLFLSFGLVRLIFPGVASKLTTCHILALLAMNDTQTIFIIQLHHRQSSFYLQNNSNQKNIVLFFKKTPSFFSTKYHSLLAVHAHFYLKSKNDCRLDSDLSMIFNLQNVNNTVMRVLILMLLLHVIHTRVVQKQVPLGTIRKTKGWTYVDRMMVHPGTMQVMFSVSLISESTDDRLTYPITLYLIKQADWAAQSTLKCQNKQTQQHVAVELTVTPTHKSMVMAPSRRSITLDNPEGESYYLVVKDCGKKLINQYFNKRSKLVMRSVVMHEGRHYGADEGKYFYVLPLLILVHCGMIYLNREGDREAFNLQGTTHWGKVLLKVTLWGRLVSLCWFMLGFIIYCWSGEIYGVFDVAYMGLFIICDGILSGIVLFMGYGWMINYTQSYDFDVYVPLVGMLGLVNVILCLLGKINDGDGNKFHMYDSIPSYMLVGVKVFSVLMLVIGLVVSYGKAKVEGKLFLRQLSMFSILYLLWLPMTVLFIGWISEPLQASWVLIGQEFATTVLCGWLTYSFCKGNSAFGRAAHHSRSFMHDHHKYL